ncbi:MAG TPA: hypothetical protein VGB79_02465 [Allosphingosinicella sp.]|jgi:hypothetical protein
MKLISVEASRVISLASLRTTKGRPFSPQLLGAILDRYKFQHFPDKVPDPSATESINLKVGNWSGIQIDELSAYNDGIIVATQAPNSVLDEFLDDLYEFLEASFGIDRVPLPVEERHYESGVVVEMDRRIEQKMSFLSGLYRDLAGFYSEYGYGNSEFRLGGFQVETEATAKAHKSPLPFTFVRRREIPFDVGYWFSTAPLRTSDHVAVLENLERQLL